MLSPPPFLGGPLHANSRFVTSALKFAKLCLKRANPSYSQVIFLGKHFHVRGNHINIVAHFIPLYSFQGPKSLNIVARPKHSSSYLTFLIVVTILLASLIEIGSRTSHTTLLFHITTLYPFHVPMLVVLSK